MKLGQTLIKIRKERNMTQEKFAEIFHVTRQTVSNWENEKSYPDLQTLVNISDEFGISLDVMLKEDTKMVKKIDHQIKFGKRSKLAVLCCTIALVVVAGIWALVWWNVKSTVEEKFQNGVEACAFEFDEQLGYYVKEISDHTYYTLPNQKMPRYLDFTLDFYAKFLDCYTKVGDESLWIRQSDQNDPEGYGVTIYRLDKDGKIRERLTEKEEQEYVKENQQIATLLKDAEEIYNSVYK